MHPLIAHHELMATKEQKQIVRAIIRICHELKCSETCTPSWERYVQVYPQDCKNYDAKIRRQIKDCIEKGLLPWDEGTEQ